MFVYINGIRQIFRTPAKTILFILLLSISTAFLSIGAGLWLSSVRNLKAFEESFITIGTVRQKPNMIDTVAEWDAAREMYSYINRPVYDAEIPIAVLDFESAGYIHSPEKRPTYGAYHEGYIIKEYNDLRRQWTILEAEPVEDCVPSKPVSLKVKRVLWGDIGYYVDEILFCDHYNDVPEPLYAGKTYIMSVQRYPVTVNPGYADLGLGPLYYPAAGTESRQYNAEGARIPDAEGITGSWYDEITSEYYETPRGKRWQEVMRALDKLSQTIPVVPTNATHLLMDFYDGNADIIEGRDISAEEYANGGKVCLVLKLFAENNGLRVGDTLPLPLYYTDYQGYSNIRYAGLNAEGKSYPVFENSEYTIIGIYDKPSNRMSPSISELGVNTVIIPSASVENSDENNIIYYSPMREYNTSFEIPNGTADSFMKELSNRGINGLDIQFYDKGFTQLKDGLDKMHAVSLILLVIGTAVILLVLTFFTFLFIVKNKRRAAVERSLGLGRVKCAASLLSGMLLLIVLGTLLGTVAGYALGGFVMERTASAINDEAYDLLYSSWVHNTDKTPEIQMNFEPAGINFFIVVACVVLVTGAMIASIGVHRNLRHEPLALLRMWEDE